MLNMYKSRTVNITIFVGAAVAFALTTWLVRSQVTVSGIDYMQAMIPHHSIAILTSERAGIEDPRVRKLADEIIDAQRKEIAEMKYLIRAIEREGGQLTGKPEPPAEEMPAGEAVRTADFATTDLESMMDAELRRMLGSGPICRFAYAAGDAAVAAATAPGAGASRGVIKLHGRLVRMDVRYGTSASEVTSCLATTSRSWQPLMTEAPAVTRVRPMPCCGLEVTWRSGTADSTSARDSEPQLPPFWGPANRDSRRTRRATSRLTAAAGAAVPRYASRSFLSWSTKYAAIAAVT